VTIIVKKWQQFLEIQGGDGHHLELWLLKFFDVIGLFKIKVLVFLLNLAMIGLILSKWQLFIEIQDGSRHHLEKYTSG